MTSIIGLRKIETAVIAKPRSYLTKRINRKQPEKVTFKSVAAEKGASVLMLQDFQFIWQEKLQRSPRRRTNFVGSGSRSRQPSRLVSRSFSNLASCLKLPEP